MGHHADRTSAHGDAPRERPDPVHRSLHARGTWGGILVGVGLGGFVDGIVFHQLLQWHHLVSSNGGPRPRSLDALEYNVLWDGIFHVGTWLATLAGVFLLVLAVRAGGADRWSARRVTGLLLLGWGAFDVADGVVNHLLLGLHHLNETGPRAGWVYWDIGYVAAGAAIAVAGYLLARPLRATSRA